jgi:hypothetical protein
VVVGEFDADEFAPLAQGSDAGGPRAGEGAEDRATWRKDLHQLLHHIDGLLRDVYTVLPELARGVEAGQVDGVPVGVALALGSPEDVRAGLLEAARLQTRDRLVQDAMPRQVQPAARSASVVVGSSLQSVKTSAVPDPTVARQDSVSRNVSQMP